MTFGERLFAEMNNRARPLGRKLTPAEFVALADQQFALESVAKKRKPKGAQRERNPLFDALALATGCRDVTQITRNGGKQIGVALADILAVCPDLTVDEIRRRGDAYRKRWPDPRNLSATALAKHWHEFGQSQEQRTRAALADPYQEPAKDWKALLLLKYSGSPLSDDVTSGVKTWFDVPLDVRTLLLKELLP